MEDKLILCLSDGVEFYNSHHGNTLEEIFEKDWLLSEDEKDIKGISDKYKMLFTNKYLEESEEASKLDEEAGSETAQYNLAELFWLCMKKLRKLGE